MADEQALASQLDLVRACRLTQPGLTSAVLAATVLSGLLPTAFSVAGGATIGTLRAASRTGLDSPAGHRLDLLLAVAVALFVAMQALGPVRETLADSLMVRVDADMARRLMRLTSGPTGVAHLEDPERLDDEPSVLCALDRGGGPDLPPGCPTASTPSSVPSSTAGSSCPSASGRRSPSAGP